MIHMDNKQVCTWYIGCFETNTIVLETNPIVYGTIFQPYLGNLV